MPRQKPDHEEMRRRIIEDEYRRRGLDQQGCLPPIVFIPIVILFFLLWLYLVNQPYSPPRRDPNIINPATEEGREQIRRSAEEYRRNHPDAPIPSFPPSP